MALSASILKGLIVTELQALGQVDDASKQEAFAEAIANAIVTHITTAAVVTSNGATLPGSPGGPLTIAALPGTVG